MYTHWFFEPYSIAPAQSGIKTRIKTKKRAVKKRTTTPPTRFDCLLRRWSFHLSLPLSLTLVRWGFSNFISLWSSTMRIMNVKSCHCWSSKITSLYRKSMDGVEDFFDVVWVLMLHCGVWGFSHDCLRIIDDGNFSLTLQMFLHGWVRVLRNCFFKSNSSPSIETSTINCCPILLSRVRRMCIHIHIIRSWSVLLRFLKVV